MIHIYIKQTILVNKVSTFSMQNIEPKTLSFKYCSFSLQP